MTVNAETVPAWQRGKVASWLVTTDHKRIGILYISTALVFFCLAGLMALVFRLQLSQASADVLGADRFKELVTIYDTTMVFLVIVPLFAGFANHLVPLMIGTTNVAFPRLNALSYWLFFLGGVTLMLSFFADGGGARAGWTADLPLSTQAPGNGQDLWILSLLILAASSLAGAINFIVTIHNLRTSGMTWTRMPLFVWSIELYAWLLLAILPVLAAGLTLLLLDRGISFGPWDVQKTFFNSADGGSTALYRQAFWFLGHPEICVIALPAIGIISEVLAVFARKPIVGYKAIVASTIAIVASTIAIAFLSMVVWGRDALTVDLPISLRALSVVASLLVALGMGVVVFSWFSTLWRGNPRFDTPMLYGLGFLLLVVIGSVTGIYLAALPIDSQVRDSYFAVAHIHYALFGSALFAIFAGLFYWWPKMFGRRLSERLGKWQFWILLIGFNVAFSTQYIVGHKGMPRDVDTYPNESWAGYNLASTVGFYVMGIAILFFIVNVVRTSRSGPRVGNDPWQADTLEWYTTSPPPPHNFDDVPSVTSARPLYDLRRKLREKSGVREPV